MKYRRFGRTGLEISELVLGGGWVGGLLIQADDETKRAALARATAAGVNWIDTAASYGQGQSETAIGWLLEELDTRPIVSTKVRLDPARLDDIPGQIEGGMHESLARLRLESVELFQLHNPLAGDGRGDSITLEHVLGAKGAAEGLERMRDQGLTRFIGMTALGDAAMCRDAIDSGRFDSAQVYYNLLNPSAGRAMPEAWTGQSFAGLIEACRKHDTAVMAIRILAAGVLASEQRHGREIVVAEASDVPTEEIRARSALSALGLEESGRTAHGTRAQTALRFVLANPDIAGAVIGLAELDHLDEALAAVEAGPLPDDALAALDAVYAANFGLGS